MKLNQKLENDKIYNKNKLLINNINNYFKKSIKIINDRINHY